MTDLNLTIPGPQGATADAAQRLHMLTPVAELALVYRGGGRRWFTLRAAARAIAKQRIYARYAASGDDVNDTDPDELRTDIDRRARLYGQRFRRHSALALAQGAAPDGGEG